MAEPIEEKPTTPLGAYVSTRTVERLREVARLEDRSVSSVVRLALDSYLFERESERVAS